MWSDHLAVFWLIEPVLELAIILVSITEVHKNGVGGGGAKERAAGIEIALPILLHHSIHDMRLHHFKRIQVLQVIQRIFVHKVSLTD